MRGIPFQYYKEHTRAVRWFAPAPNNGVTLVRVGVKVAIEAWVPDVSNAYQEHHMLSS